MKYSNKKFIWILTVAMAIALFPLWLMAKGGVYTSTKHGNLLTGVYRITTEPRGACSQCHYEHASYRSFAVGGPYEYLLFAANNNNLCYVCHNTPSTLNNYQGAAGYNQSSHATKFSVVWPGFIPPPRPSSDGGKCVNCHNPHGYKDASGLIPNMNFSREENLCLACHSSSGPGRKDIQSQLQKPFKHPVTAYMGRHTASEGGNPAKFEIANRHSECEDCHNPHIAKANLIAPAAPNASNRSIGVSRIKVTNGAAGTTPTYTYKAPNDTTFVNEYEVCFKCHSSWTSLPPGKPDLSVPFNTNNPSYHPVEAQGKNPNIHANSFANNWTWDRLMYCMDCHSSDDTTVKGPHGSRYNYLLKKDYRATVSQRAMSSAELCFDCHRYDTYANDSANDTLQGYSRFNKPGFSGGHAFHVGNKQYSCYNCHQTHGSTTTPALIATGRTPGLANYTQTSTGGTCYPTCHGSQTYTINYAR